jgi:hypoxanthine phosphoribosyltransferase
VTASLGETLIDASAIQTRVVELGRDVSEAYAQTGMPLILVCVLKGAVFFGADLGRAITIPVEFEFIACRSYGASTTTSGNVELTKDVGRSLEGRDVLVVEDIVDTGLTTSFVMDHLRSQKPASVRLAALLNKQERRVRDITPDFCGFEIPDKFVVGYGLDLAEAYRNLRDIRVISDVNS